MIENQGEQLIVGISLILIILIIILCKQIYNFNKRDSKKNQNPELKQYNEQYRTVEEIEKIKQVEEKIDYTGFMPYSKKYLLTKNEWFFYKVLKQIANELGYTVLAKVRVADLVEVTTRDYTLKGFYLNKVVSKHIDFVLARPENLQVVLLIELDDNSHDNKAKQERDEFIDKLYKQTGYKFIRIRGTGNLKEIIKEQLEQ